MCRCLTYVKLVLGAGIREVRDLVSQETGGQAREGGVDWRGKYWRVLPHHKETKEEGQQTRWQEEDRKLHAKLDEYDARLELLSMFPYIRETLNDGSV